MRENNTWLKKNSTVILLVLILLFALILRVYALGKAPMWVDETISSLAATKILENGLPMFDSGMLYTRALLFHYMQAFFILFSHTDFAARLVSVFCGLATVLLAFYIGKQFNNATGLTAALLTAVFFLEVLYSRQARFYQLFQLLFFLTIFLLYKSKESKKYAWFASLALLLTVQTQIAGLVLVPFCLLFFYLDHKDWKLLIIPAALGAYYGFSFLSISTSTSLASIYAETYSTIIYNKLRGFFFISMLGIPFAFRSNKRLLFLVLLPSLVLFTGLFFVKVFAVRYAYFVILTVIILIAVIFSYIAKHNKILFVLALTFAIIYPSNLFFDYGYLTVIKPIDTYSSLQTEPVIDYKSLGESVRKEIETKPIVTIWTPGVEWYLKKPDYFIPFTLNGLPTGYALYKGKDAYTGVEEFTNQTNEFIFIDDVFGGPKLTKERRAFVATMKESCTQIDEAYGVRVYSCSL